VGKGSGQGLAIAQSMIDKHSGALSIESSPGDGATFTIKLPLAEEPALTKS
jgi:signal transduction histidine kinase